MLKSGTLTSDAFVVVGLAGQQADSASATPTASTPAISATAAVPVLKHPSAGPAYVDDGAQRVYAFPVTPPSQASFDSQVVLAGCHSLAYTA